MTSEAQLGVHSRNKLNPRAWVGYLVGYDASTIYRIWNPQSGRVIRTRDVTFDEASFYEPDQEKMRLLVNQVDTVMIADLLQQDESPKGDLALHNNLEDLALDDFDLPHSTQVAATEDMGSSREAPLDEPVTKELITPEELAPYPTPPDSPTALLAALVNRPCSHERMVPYLARWTPIISGRLGEQTASRSTYGLAAMGPSLQVAAHVFPRSKDMSPLRLDLVWPRAMLAAQRSSVIKDMSGRRWEKGALLRKAACPPIPMSGQSQTISNDKLAGWRAETGVLNASDLPDAPRNQKELFRHPLKDEFQAAERAHLQSHAEAGTWAEVPKVEATSKPLNCMWVYVYKFAKNGNLEKLKARLVVRGDEQDKDLLRETYAATLAMKSFRILMTAAARFNLELKQYDAVNAFVNAKLDEPVYMRMPVGYGKPDIVLKLHRALYGLCQSPLLWYRELSGALVILGFVQIPHEPCAFIRGGCILFFYVDDIIVAYKKRIEPDVCEVMDRLKQRFTLTGGDDLQWFLGVEVLRDRRNRLLWLSQQSYLIKISKLTDKLFNRSPKTPLADSNLEPSTGTATRDSIRRYQRKIGSILYAAIITRPDIAFSCAKLARFNCNPDQSHHDAADRVLQYLHDTETWGLQLGGGNRLEVYSDASFADNRADRKSSQAFVIQLFGGTVGWQSNKQATVTTSTTEAELLALAQASKEAMFTRRLIDEFGLETDDDVLVVRCDNTATIRLINSEFGKLNTALRHVDIYHHWLRQAAQNKQVSVQYMPSKELPADGMTKALGYEEFRKFRVQIGVVNLGSRLVASKDKVMDVNEVEDLLFDVKKMSLTDTGFLKHSDTSMAAV